VVSSLMKQKKKGKICFVIHIAGFFFLKKFCYEVFAKQKKTERCRLYCSSVPPRQTSASSAQWASTVPQRLRPAPRPPPLRCPTWCAAQRTSSQTRAAQARANSAPGPSASSSQSMRRLQSVCPAPSASAARAALCSRYTLHSRRVCNLRDFCA
jgi:hypothetical protein